MEIKKHAATALIAALVGALAGAGAQHAMPGKERIVEKQTQVTVAASKHAWPDLTQDETIAIGESLASLKDATVHIFCNDAACNDLAHDLDDAMEIAGANSTLDQSALPMGYGFSVITKEGDDRGQAVAESIKAATAGRLSPDARHDASAQGAIVIAIGKHPHQ
jgi:hypothetical protein